MRTNLVVVMTLLFPVAAHAQQNESDDSGVDEPREDAYELPAKQVTPKSAGPRIDDERGGATGYVVNEGVYVQGALGGFLRFGGFDVARGRCPEIACVPVLTSNTQVGGELALGVDVTSWLAAQVQGGVGYVASAAAYGNRDAEVPRDYALSRAELALAARLDVIERIAATFTIGAGAANITPSPGFKQPSFGLSTSLGAGVRLLSLLPSMTVGADVSWHGALFPAKVPNALNVDDAPLFIHGLSFAPVIKYVF